MGSPGATGMTLSELAVPSPLLTQLFAPRVLLLASLRGKRDHRLNLQNSNEEQPVSLMDAGSSARELNARV